MRAKEAERAAQMFQKNKPDLHHGGDDDMFFDAKEFQTSNKEVANILSQAAQISTGSGGLGGELGNRAAAAVAANIDVGGADWGDGDELDIDADNILGGSGQADDLIGGEIGSEVERHGVHQNNDSDIFVPPS